MSEEGDIREIVESLPRFIHPVEAASIFDGLAQIIPSIETIHRGESEVINWALAGSLALKVFLYELAKRGEGKEDVTGENGVEELVVDWKGNVIKRKRVSFSGVNFSPLVLRRETKDVDVVKFCEGQDFPFDIRIDDITDGIVKRLVGKDEVKILRLGDRLILHPSIILI